MAKAYEILPPGMASMPVKGTPSITGGTAVSKAPRHSTGALSFVPGNVHGTPTPSPNSWAYGGGAAAGAGKQPKAYEILPAAGVAIQGLGHPVAGGNKLSSSNRQATLAHGNVIAVSRAVRRHTQWADSLVDERANGASTEHDMPEFWSAYWNAPPIP